MMRLARMDPRFHPYLALLPPLVAFVVQLLLWSLISPYVWFLFYPAVFLSSWIGGFRRGLVATAASAGLVWWFFVEPTQTLVKPQAKSLFPLLVFIAMGVGFSVFQERLKLANQRGADALAETREANESLSAANDHVTELLAKTREVDAIKTRFFANVSHELRTPLTLIMGPAQRLLDSPDLPPATRPFVELIDRNARKLLSQVNDLLEASKLEAGQVDLDYAEVDLAELVRVVADQFTGLAADKQIAYTISAEEPVPAQVDPDQLQRALTNLLSNAFKFTPASGKVRVALRTGGGEAILDVADSGPGIAPEHRELVFERFQQVEGGASRRFGGTGLGLAIARDVTLLHAGKLTVDDAPEGGARFQLTLPLRAPLLATIRPRTPVLSAGSDLPAAAPALRPQRGDPIEPPAQTGSALVLVVEDNPDVSRLICASLADNYQVVAAASGREGLASALELRPTLILCDLMMPEMSGEEFIRQVRADHDLADTPVVVLTARADDELRVRLLREGANDYLTKPFVIAELRARAANLVRLKLAELAQLRANAELRVSEDRFRRVFDEALTGKLIVNSDGNVVRVNTTLARMLGREPPELIGAPLSTLFHDTADQLQIHELIEAGDGELRAELALRHAAGRSLWALVALSWIAEPDGQRVLFVQIEDITARRDAEQRLTELALHDELTGLANRRLLLERCEHAFAVAKSGRTGATSVAALFIDLDGFKPINDRAGHDAGDQLLVAIAHDLQTTLRPTDTVARVGGDEFVVLLEQDDGLDYLRAVAERITSVIRRQVSTDDAPLTLSASVGIARVDLAREPEVRPDQLLRRADAAMYRAKERGRNRYDIFDADLRGRTEARQVLVQTMRDGLLQDRITLVFQPIIDVDRNFVVSAEALLRLTNAQGQLVPTLPAIIAAESAGLAEAISDRVLRLALDAARTWPAQLSVAVNISARELTGWDLRSRVEEALQRHDFDPARLILEITESSILSSGPSSLAELEALRQLGVRVAIDDFGTAYATLQNLTTLPVDALKVDSSFTAGLPDQRTHTAIVHGIASMAHELNIPCIVEGVETSVQLAAIRGMSVQAQGWLWGKPQGPERIPKLRPVPRPRTLPETASAPAPRSS